VTGYNKGIQLIIKPHHRFFAALAGVCLLMTMKTARGQESLRISMAGDIAAESRQQNNSSIGYYNLLLGPTAWRFSSGLGLEFNSNVRLQADAESDLIIRPNFDTELHWPVTQKNSLDVSLGVGYSEYLQHQDLSQFYITPGSGFSFDVFVGDFKINLHDRITITENAYQNTAAGGQNQNLVSLENTIGTSALWDLGKVVSNLGYDHDNYVSLSQGQQSQPDANSENFFANSGVRIRPELLVGLETGTTLISYSQNSSSNSIVQPDAVQWNAGIFASAQISDYINTRVDAGYTDYTPDTTSTNLVVRDSSGFYVSVSLSHRVNQHVNYTLTAGRSTDLSAYGQAQSYYFVRLTPNWNFFRKYSVSTPIFWQQGTRVYNTIGTSAANYEQFGFGLNITRILTRKLSVSLSYQFVEESSDVLSYNYTDNIVDLNFTYQF
jgi:hypothetical protein